MGQYPLEHQAHTFMKSGEPYFEELSKNLFLLKIPYGGGELFMFPKDFSSKNNLPWEFKGTAS